MIIRTSIWRVMRAAMAVVALGVLVGILAGPAPAQDGGDAIKFVELTTEDDANCVRWDGKLVLVRNTHPTRRIKVWLDRYHMGTGTGDRSHSDLAPMAEPEPLGCSRTQYGKQEWRVVRATFLD
jgi:hypothetical protein